MASHGCVQKVYRLVEMRLVKRGFLLHRGSTGKGRMVSHLKRSRVMVAFIKTLHLLLKTGRGGSFLACYKHMVSPLLIILLTTSFEEKMVSTSVCLCVCVCQ